MMEDALHCQLIIGQGRIQNQGITSLQVVVESVGRQVTEIIIINSNVLMWPIKQLRNLTIAVINTIITTLKEVIWDMIADVICMD